MHKNTNIDQYDHQKTLILTNMNILKTTNVDKYMNKTPLFERY